MTAMWRLLALVVILSGCALIPISPENTPVMVVIPSLTPRPPMATDTAPAQIPTPELPGQIQDVLPIMNGICFESAWDAAGRVFVFRNADEHIRFYDLADHSRLCRRPVTRYPFDFTQGDVLAGLWTRGTGCVARHEVTGFQRDDAAKMISINLNFIDDGDCPYELVRPFWVSIPQAQDYQIEITVNRS